MNSRQLHIYSVFVSACTLALIIAGGLVTSTESGLSVPDWPLSYGQFFPPMIGGIRFEHTHRVIAAFVGFLTLILSLFLWKWEKRTWVKRLGFLALVAVVVQAVLGGLTVRYLLPKPISVAHACLGQSFFALTAAIALFTSKEWLEAPRAALSTAKSVFRLSLITTVFIFIQLLLGAMVRHNAAPVILVHFAVAFLILLHVALHLGKAGREDASDRLLSRHALILGFMVLVQIFLGFGAFIFTQMLEKADYPRTGEVLFATAHQATGALILAGSVLLTLRSRRLFRDA